MKLSRERKKKEIKLWIEDRMHTKISNRVSNWFPFLANNISLTMRCKKMNHEFNSTKKIYKIAFAAFLSRETAWLIDGNFVAPTTIQSIHKWNICEEKSIDCIAEVAYFIFSVLLGLCCAMCSNDYRHQQFIPS